jgi:hypothetical protein
MSEVISGWNTYACISANGTTVLRSAGAGSVRSVAVTSKGGAGCVLTLYDAASATSPIIAVIDMADSVRTIELDCAYNVGLTAVMGGGAAGAATILWN